jgi:hypothetical protein
MLDTRGKESRRKMGNPSQTISARLKRLDGQALCLLACVLSITVVVASCGRAPVTPAVRRLPAFEISPSLPSDIVVNAEQGLGQCHWLDPQLLSQPQVAWAYDAGAQASAWSAVEPQQGVFQWSALDAEIAKARANGKRIWLELLTTEGLAPQWARDAGVELVGSVGGTPIPWNETYQRLLRRAVHAMAARYDDDPTVDAVILMAGGCYGEMTICSGHTDQSAWEQAGYTDARFIEAVKAVVDIYLEDEYVWEDGTRTHGFLKTPVVLQLGSGLYGHTTAVISPIVEYAISNYGMRVWLKFNGWGGTYDMGWLYDDYDELTRVGYEPSGTSADFLSSPVEYVQAALDQHASYVCLQKLYFDQSDSSWVEARELAARHLGAQIVHQGTDAPDAVQAGQEYVFTTKWVNRGTTPLMRPERRGIKDVPASYDVVIAFVDSGSGSSVFEYTFTPDIPTSEWYSAQAVQLEQSVRIPASVPSGEYDLRIALRNPNVTADDDRRHFRLVNEDIHDGSGRYTVGTITVVGGRTPLATHTATPTRLPTPTATVSPSPTPSSPATSTATARPSSTPTPHPSPTVTATPSPSATMPAGEVTVTLQQGAGGYTGGEDSYIYLYTPSRTYCSVNSFRVGYRQRYAALLRFDVSSIPADAAITRASLEVYAAGWGGSDITIEAFRVLRDCDPCQATWNRAQEGVQWAIPGCEGVGSDRGAELESSVSTDSVKKWYAFDLTLLVQDWVAGSAANNGVLLRGASPWAGSAFYFLSAQDSNIALRPKLVITYQTPTGPTATTTATLAPSETFTPSATPTSSPTVSVTAAATRTPSRTPSPSPTFPSGETTITLQQGSSGYSGAEDAYIYQYTPVTNYCGVNTFRVGYRQRYATLLHFDLSPIPANTAIAEATLHIYATGWGGSNMTIDAFRIVRDTDPCQATWNQAQQGSNWALPGANDTIADRAPTPESSVTTNNIRRWYTFDLTALVQDWIDGRLHNNGLLLRGASPWSTSMFHFLSAQDGSISLRPKLVVTYRAPNGVP